MAIQAILGGTFNPPHLGHIEPALHLLPALKTDKLGLMPCKIAPHKSVSVNEKHRVNMVHLCCELDKRLYPELIELSLPAPSYTVKTLQALKQRDNQTICFFIGADSLYNLASWFEWEHLLDYCHLIVMRRNSETFLLPESLVEWLNANKTEDYEQLHTRPNGCILLADTPLHTVSSTELRNAIHDNEPKELIDRWLPSAVKDYIYQHQLYQEPSNM